VNQRPTSQASSKQFRFEVLSPKDILPDPISVEEDADTLEGNAVKKVVAYADALTKLKPHERSEIYVVLGDDTGLSIHALNGEPGIKVRRWKDGKTEMPDEDLIRYALQRLSGASSRKATFRACIAFSIHVVPATNGSLRHTIETVSGSLEGHILEEADPLRITGFPFESLFFVDEFQLLLGKIQLMDDETKSRFPTHRQKALALAVERINKVLCSAVQ